MTTSPQSADAATSRKGLSVNGGSASVTAKGCSPPARGHSAGSKPDSSPRRERACNAKLASESTIYQVFIIPVRGPPCPARCRRRCGWWRGRGPSGRRAPRRRPGAAPAGGVEATAPGAPGGASADPRPAPAAWESPEPSVSYHRVQITFHILISLANATAPVAHSPVPSPSLSSRRSPTCRHLRNGMGL